MADEAGLNRLAQAIRERDEARQELQELKARLEHYEGFYVPGTKLLIPCRAIKPFDSSTPPGLRCVETKHGTLLRILPGDAVLDERDGG